MKKSLYTMLALVFALGCALTSCEEAKNLGPEGVPQIRIINKVETLPVDTAYRFMLSVSISNVEWTSSEQTVATVNYKGEVKTLKAGQTWIKAERENKADSCLITVK